MESGKDVKPVDNEKIGSLIRELRRERDLTQKDLAEALHITDRAVSKWERGLCAPDIALLEPLSELLGVSVGELVRGERAREEEPEMDETKTLLEYSREEIVRKVRGERKKYAAVLAVLLLLAGALLWRSGVLFLLDKKTSPDGQSVVRVYSRDWDFWPLRFTLEERVQTVLKSGEETTYIGYGSPEWPCEYEGLWWAPDGRKYVLAFRPAGEERRVVLNWLDRHSESNLNAILNMGGEGTEYQFLQWGKDSASLLFYYRTEAKEGYFWYNCETGEVAGELELSAM